MHGLLASMKRLQTDHIDLYYLHRMGDTPVEKATEAMGRLIDEGLIGGWELSRVVIDRAQRVTPLTAIQNIYSMVERDSEAVSQPVPGLRSQGFGRVLM